MSECEFRQGESKETKQRREVKSPGLFLYSIGEQRSKMLSNGNRRKSEEGEGKVGIGGCWTVSLVSKPKRGESGVIIILLFPSEDVRGSRLIG